MAAWPASLGPEVPREARLRLRLAGVGAAVGLVLELLGEFGQVLVGSGVVGSVGVELDGVDGLDLVGIYLGGVGSLRLKPGRGMDEGVHLLEFPDSDLGVELSGSELGVSELGLDVSDVGPGLEHQGCTGMSKQVAASELAEVGGGDVLGDQRERLQGFPPEVAEEDLLRFFALSDEDVTEVRRQRGATSRLCFALNLCALRYLGFIPDNLGDVPLPVVDYVARQLGLEAEVAGYGQRTPTLVVHKQRAREYLGFERMGPETESALRGWLLDRALEHDTPVALLRMVCEGCIGRRSFGHG